MPDDRTTLVRDDKWLVIQNPSWPKGHRGEPVELRILHDDVDPEEEYSANVFARWATAIFKHGDEMRALIDGIAHCREKDGDTLGALRRQACLLLQELPTSKEPAAVGNRPDDWEERML